MTPKVGPPGRCTHSACAQDRDGDEISCMLQDPPSTRVAEHLCKFCRYWEAK